MVRLASKLTYGPLISDTQERINVERMRQYRVERARQVLRKHGVAATIEANPANIRYLTGLTGFDMAGCRYVLFFAEGDPVMFEHDGWYHQMPDQAPWIKEWRPAKSWLTGAPGPAASEAEARRFAAEIGDELRQRGLLGERIGVGGLDGLALNALHEAGVKPTVASTQLLLEARAIKNVDEIACLKMVAAIVDGMWFRVWESLRPGMKDTDLGAIVVAAGYQFGAEYSVPGGWRSGPMTFDRGPSSSTRIFKVGDMVYGSLCGVKYMGYGSCTYRTFCVGREPNQREKDWYKVLLERVNAVIEEIKPGRSTADAAKHLPPASTWGYKDEAEVLASEIGHGIGLGGGAGYDWPIINRLWSFDYPQTFEEGMCLAVECREGVPREGGVRLENMLVVTKGGAEILDDFPRDQILVAPR